MQLLLVSALIGAFFVAFGLIAVREPTILPWTTTDEVAALGRLVVGDTPSTDETWRAEFVDDIVEEVREALAVRALCLAHLSVAAGVGTAPVPHPRRGLNVLSCATTEPPADADDAPPAPPPSWAEDADYYYTLTASGGSDLLQGTFHVVVQDHQVVVSEPRDDLARDAASRGPGTPPTIQGLLDLVDQARISDPAIAEITRDPLSGGPTQIELDDGDPTLNDGRTFTINDVTPFGRHVDFPG